MRSNVVVAILLMTALSLGAIGGIAFAQKAAAPRLQDTRAMVEEHAKQLLLLMHPDEHGMVTKEQWMKFMDEEFDRLDTNKDGKINLEDLEKSVLWETHKHFQNVGK